MLLALSKIRYVLTEISSRIITVSRANLFSFSLSKASAIRSKLAAIRERKASLELPVDMPMLLIAWLCRGPGSGSQPAPGPLILPRRRGGFRPLHEIHPGGQGLALFRGKRRLGRPASGRGRQ